MPPRWISETKVSNIQKLKELGYSVTRIAELTGVSRVTVNDYTNPGFYEERLRRSVDYYRRTTIVTGASKAGALVLRGLNKRPHPGKCEMCGVSGKRLHYHHWDPDNPSMGIWCCLHCHGLAELTDELGPPDTVDVIYRYAEMKALLAGDTANSKQQSKQSLWDTE